MVNEHNLLNRYLTKREWQILNAASHMKQCEIARILGVKPPRVSFLHAKALRKRNKLVEHTNRGARECYPEIFERRQSINRLAS